MINRCRCSIQLVYNLYLAVTISSTKLYIAFKIYRVACPQTTLHNQESYDISVYRYHTHLLQPNTVTYNYTFGQYRLPRHIIINLCISFRSQVRLCPHSNSDICTPQCPPILLYGSRSSYAYCVHSQKQYKCERIFRKAFCSLVSEY